MIIVIPSRLAATRLPNKPLANIKGMPMVLQVANRAKEADIGEVIIACGDQEIADVVQGAGFKAVLTDPKIPTGTDRVYAAVKQSGIKTDYVINLQGDLPFIAPETIAKTAQILKSNEYDITTAAAKFTDIADASNPSIVKVALSYRGRALYFSRTANFPYGKDEYYHHVGIYGYKMPALEKFVSLPQTPLEKQENLEQLRALENDMSIGVAIVDQIPQSVDTLEDLIKLK